MLYTWPEHALDCKLGLGAVLHSLRGKFRDLPFPPKCCYCMFIQGIGNPFGLNVEWNTISTLEMLLSWQIHRGGREGLRFALAIRDSFTSEDRRGGEVATLASTTPERWWQPHIFALQTEHNEQRCCISVLYSTNTWGIVRRQSIWYRCQSLRIIFWPELAWILPSYHANQSDLVCYKGKSMQCVHASSHSAQEGWGCFRPSMEQSR